MQSYIVEIPQISCNSTEIDSYNYYILFIYISIIAIITFNHIPSNFIRFMYTLRIYFWISITRVIRYGSKEISRIEGSTVSRRPLYTCLQKGVWRTTITCVIQLNRGIVGTTDGHHAEEDASRLVKLRRVSLYNIVGRPFYQGLWALAFTRQSRAQGRREKSKLQAQHIYVYTTDYCPPLREIATRASDIPIIYAQVVCYRIV